MNGICRICGQEVPLTFDGERDVIDTHDDADGHTCNGSGLEPAGDYDDIEE